MRILGVDPGTRATGWALVTRQGSQSRLEAFGTVRPKGSDHASRLADLDRQLAAVVEELAPDCAAVESGFTGRNPRSGLILAESRGVVLAVLGRASVPVHPYTPAQVKSAMVGHGTAEKRQVAFMVVRLLGIGEELPSDAADAAGVALTHIHSSVRTTIRPRRS
jgi:crossover junction endodeoxyribonuclease RuvC